MNGAPSLIERRDARQIKQLARDLCVSVETIATGDGLLTLAPIAFLLQLREAFGDEGLIDVYAVIDGPALRMLKVPAGLRSIDDELKAVRDRELRATVPLAPASRPAIAPANGAPAQTGVRDVTVTPAEIRELLTRRAWTPMRLAAELVDDGVPGVSVTVVEAWLAGSASPSHRAASAIRKLIGATAEPEPPASENPVAATEDRLTGAEVRAAIDACGLSMSALAQALNVSEETVRSWRSGRYRPSAVNTQAIRRRVAEGPGR